MSTSAEIKEIDTDNTEYPTRLFAVNYLSVVCLSRTRVYLKSLAWWRRTCGQTFVTLCNITQFTKEKVALKTVILADEITFVEVVLWWIA